MAERALGHLMSIQNRGWAWAEVEEARRPSGAWEVEVGAEVHQKLPGAAEEVEEEEVHRLKLAAEEGVEEHHLSGVAEG
jgi:hypothetical protein